MKVPNYDKAIVSKEKILNYLLSESHSFGKSKTKFFRNLGFNDQNFKVFKQALENLLTNNEIKTSLLTDFGTKYIVDGSIKTPNDQLIKITTIWIIEHNKINPQLVTAYPI